MTPLYVDGYFFVQLLFFMSELILIYVRQLNEPRHAFLALALLLFWHCRCCCFDCFMLPSLFSPFLWWNILGNSVAPDEISGNIVVAVTDSCFLCLLYFPLKPPPNIKTRLSLKSTNKVYVNHCVKMYNALLLFGV